MYLQGASGLAANDFTASSSPAVVALGQAQMAADSSDQDLHCHFATPEQGKSRLAKNDAYIKGLSPFERAAKILKAGSVSTEEYIDFIGAQTLEWDENDKAKLKKIIQIASSKLAVYGISPQTFISSRPPVRMKVPRHTRGVSIVLPNRTVRQSAKGLEQLSITSYFTSSHARIPSSAMNFTRSLGFTPAAWCRCRIT